MVLWEPPPSLLLVTVYLLSKYSILVLTIIHTLLQGSCKSFGSFSWITTDTKIASGIQMWLPSCGYLAITYCDWSKVLFKEDRHRPHDNLSWNTGRSLISAFYPEVTFIQKDFIKWANSWYFHTEKAGHWKRCDFAFRCSPHSQEDSRS